MKFQFQMNESNNQEEEEDMHIRLPIGKQSL